MTPDQLKAARMKLKMSRQEIADELEMGKRTYDEREYGEMPISRLLEYAVRWMLHRAEIRRQNRAGKKRR